MEHLPNGLAFAATVWIAAAGVLAAYMTAMTLNDLVREVVKWLKKEGIL